MDNNYIKFSSDDWIIWLKNESIKENFQSIVPGNDLTLDEQLIIAYKELKKERSELTKAVNAVLFEFSREKLFPEVVYCLLLFLGRVQPEEYVGKLEWLLKGGYLNNFYYKEINLETLLLNEIVNFQNIGTYKEYFYRLLFSHDFNMVVIGFKYFNRHENAYEYFAYLSQVLLEAGSINMEPDKLIGHVVRSLNDFSFHRMNFVDIHEWINRFWPSLATQAFILYEKLNVEILTWLHPANSIISIDRNVDAIAIKKLCENALRDITSYKTPISYYSDKVSWSSATSGYEFIKEINDRLGLIIHGDKIDINVKYDAYLQELNELNSRALEDRRFALELKNFIWVSMENEML